MSRLKTDAGTWPLLKPLDEGFAARGIVLNRDVCVVGRARVHLPLLNIEVSRTHALVVNEGKSIYVRDLASKNGVYRNGEPVRETELLTSDVLAIGPMRFRCESGFKYDESNETLGAPLEARLILDGTAVALPVSQRTFLIGTRAGCDAVLQGTGISPVHAVIFRRAGQHFVRDLNSQGGTFLNGRRTRESNLSTGDEIRTGTVILRYEFEPPPPPAADGLDTTGLIDPANTDRAVSTEDVIADDAIRVWDLMDLDAEPHEQEQTQPIFSFSPDSPPGLEEAPEKDDEAQLQVSPLPGRNAWREEVGGPVTEPSPPEPSIERFGGNGEPDESVVRQEEVKVRRLLARLSRNVAGLKSAWSTLYGRHGRDDGRTDTSRRPD